jgi:hypothetical protein
MANEKKGGAAPAKENAAASTDATPKTRNRLSPAKALAIQIAGLVAILITPKVAGVLTEPQKAQVAAAEAAAKELNDQTIKPIKDRIEAIAKEFDALSAKFREPGVAEKVKELSADLARQEKKLQALTASA